MKETEDLSREEELEAKVIQLEDVLARMGAARVVELEAQLLALEAVAAAAPAPDERPAALVVVTNREDLAPLQRELADLFDRAGADADKAHPNAAGLLNRLTGTLEPAPA